MSVLPRLVVIYSSYNLPAINEIVSKSNTTIKEEISTWDVSDKKVAQVYKLAYRYIAEKSVDR